MTVLFNQANIIDLIEKHAKELAENIGRSDDTTKSQLRRFYQEFNHLRNHIASAPEEFDKSYIAIKMLIPKAEYALGRKDVKIPAKFVRWFIDNLRAIKKPQDVETFGLYFEALIGYFWAVGTQQPKDSHSRGPRSEGRSDYQQGGVK